MPKLKPNDTELKRRAVRQVIIGNQELWGVDNKELSKSVHCCAETIRWRLEHPGVQDFIADYATSHASVYTNKYSHILNFNQAFLFAFRTEERKVFKYHIFSNF